MLEYCNVVIYNCPECRTKALEQCCSKIAGHQPLSNPGNIQNVTDTEKGYKANNGIQQYAE